MLLVKVNGIVTSFSTPRIFNLPIVEYPLSVFEMEFCRCSCKYSLTASFTHLLKSFSVGINNVSDAEEAAELFEGDELEKRLATIEKRGFTLVGDVNPKDAMKKAASFTPVPGGIGLLTVAMLMKNTVTAAKLRRKID